MNGTGLPVIIGMDHNLDLLKQKTYHPTKLFVDKLLDSNMVSEYYQTHSNNEIQCYFNR